MWKKITSHITTIGFIILLLLLGGLYINNRNGFFRVKSDTTELRDLNKRLGRSNGVLRNKLDRIGQTVNKLESDKRSLESENIKLRQGLEGAQATVRRLQENSGKTTDLLGSVELENKRFREILEKYSNGVTNIQDSSNSCDRNNNLPTNK